MKYNKSLPKDRKRKVFERVVNPLLIKYLVSPWIEMDKHINGKKVTNTTTCIAANIPIKYLSYFKEVSASRRAKNVRYRYRGKSKPGYQRPQSFCHMHGADTFSVYNK